MTRPPSIIEKLRNATPQKRVKIINKLYNKNLGYFAVKHPVISQMLKDVPCPYELTITDTFLDVIDGRTGEKCHPDIGLDYFAEALGDWTSKGWVDFLSPKLNYVDFDWNHCRLLMKFNKLMLEASPDFIPRVGSHAIHLQKTEDGLRFSNPVAFVGIFHGLHIAHYLSRTHVRTAIFLEPEPHRFEVSCYFLDYAAIDKQFEGLLLHVGDKVPNLFFTTMLRKALISNTVWTRVLGGYASEHIEPVIRHLRMSWASINDEWLPADREINGFKYGIENLETGRPLLVSPITLSPESRIVVVGAGPSLNDDLDWLRKNRDGFLVFAVHSALIPLRKHGITPDFQFSLDLEMTDQQIKDHEFDFSVPLVALYTASPIFLGHFQSVCMVADPSNTTMLHFNNIINYTQPTTGNLALALACYCHPAELYLVGLDLAFRKLGHTHATGGIYELPGMEEKVAGDEQWEVEANFPDAEPVYTRHYFNTARQQAGIAINNLAGTTRVYNLSDGAKIEGTEPRRSRQCTLAPYPEKQSDRKSILNAFAPASEGVHWNRYSIPGKDLLNIYKKTLLEKLHLETFSWPDFSKTIDTALWKTHMACNELSDNDNRMIPYFRIIHDLLLSWYRVMIFTQSNEEAAALHQTGLSQLSEIIDKFEWPDNLD